MKRWLVITGLLATLILIVLVILKGRSPFGRSNSDFSIDWIEEVNSIQIIDGDEELLLKKSGDEWQVNNSFSARSSAIEFILKTIESIEIKSPVSSELFKELVDDKDLNPVSVIISNGKRKSSKLLIYNGLDSQSGSIIKRTLSSKPFFVNIPGYETDPGSHFISTEKFWIPFNIFRLHPDSILSVSIHYNDVNQDDIRITIINDSIELLLNDSLANISNNDNIKRYLSYFAFVPFETWVFDPDPNLKSYIQLSDPEIVISVGLDDGNSVVARFWNRFLETPEGLVPDTDRLLGTLNDANDIFVVRYFDLDPLIKSSDYFIRD